MPSCTADFTCSFVVNGSFRRSIYVIPEFKSRFPSLSLTVLTCEHEQRVFPLQRPVDRLLLQPDSLVYQVLGHVLSVAAYRAGEFLWVERLRHAHVQVTRVDSRDVPQVDARFVLDDEQARALGRAAFTLLGRALAVVLGCNVQEELRIHCTQLYSCFNLPDPV